MKETKAKILVVDDEERTRELLRRNLSRRGYAVTTASGGAEGIRAYVEGLGRERDGFDVVIVDYRMPEVDGMVVVRELKRRDPSVSVIMITAYGSIPSAVEAMKAGAAEYITKPLDMDQVDLMIEKALRMRALLEENRRLRTSARTRPFFEGLVGGTPIMQEMYGLIEKVAPGDTTVLIQGENGTGKELVAKAIHRLSKRKNRRFIPISCGALPEALLESELFGHEVGAFTGAVRLKYGLLEQAKDGTLFLDEVEAMSPALQMKLLRALQEREILRVGGIEPIPVSFRLIAASNRSLEEEVQAGRFRQDLFYRLNVVVISVPPLRDRKEDIPLLARHFLERYAGEKGRPVSKIRMDAMVALTAYDWPGNVRELENCIERAVVLTEGAEITARDLPSGVTGVPQGMEDLSPELPLREARSQFERAYLERILRQTGGNVARAAERAGLNRQHMYQKLRQYGISVRRVRKE